MIEIRCGHEECADGESNEYDRPVNVHGLTAEATKVEPHDESQVKGEDCGQLETY
jgi:hypothetical protein